MHFLTDEELIAQPIGQFWEFDIEVFKNFLFIAFKKWNAEEFLVFYSDENTKLDVPKLEWFLSFQKLVGFNSWNFDLLILAGAIATGGNPADTKRFCDQIIIDKVRHNDFTRKFNVKLPILNQHIDLMEVCPLKGGLKLYGARLHAPKIQDIPVHPESFLTEEQKGQVGNYCLNDLRINELIHNELIQELKLREVMGELYEIDLMSRSDAQIAERVMGAEIQKRTGNRVEKPLIPPGTVYRYAVPDWMFFQTERIQKLLEDVRQAEFVVGAKGACTLPKELEGREVVIGKGVYRLGIGGLHSSEKCQALVSTEERVLVDRDVASYYPAIILNQRLFPEHIGPVFIDVYQEVVDRRLEAKKVKSPEADSLKIVINGTYGKFGSRWSILYAPQLSIQVTMTGQLALLMLIEAAELAGFTVVSANTDGMVFYVKREEKEALDHLIYQWEMHTGFTTEETIYSGLYSRDVNNYVAIKEDGKAKTKGAYLLPEKIFRFHKNPDCNIVSKAVIEYLTKGTLIEQTIADSRDITDFVTVRSVTGGAVWAGQEVGKVVRWYYSRHCTQAIHYGPGSDKEGDKVPSSEGARVVQELPTIFPDDIDYPLYISMAQKALLEIGAIRPETDDQFIFSLSELED